MLSRRAPRRSFGTVLINNITDISFNFYQLLPILIHTLLQLHPPTLLFGGGDGLIDLLPHKLSAGSHQRCRLIHLQLHLVEQTFRVCTHFSHLLL